jgi:hypothetical protein
MEQDGAGAVAPATGRAGRHHTTDGFAVAQDDDMNGATSDAKSQRILHRRLDKAERHLPRLLADWVAHLRKPSASWVRVPLGVLLLVGGLLGFLPILGFWMAPLGLILLALDFALLRRPTARMIIGGERLVRRFRRRRRENKAEPPRG